MAVKAEMAVALRPIDLREPDALRHFYGFRRARWVAR